VFATIFFVFATVFFVFATVFFVKKMFFRTSETAPNVSKTRFCVFWSVFLRVLTAA
jgi:hypothetical protein